MLHLGAFNFAGLMTASTVLICDNLARPAGTLMAAVRTNMPTIQFISTRHSTHRNVISTAFPVIGISSQHFNRIFSTWTGSLKLRSMRTIGTFSKMTLYLTFMVATSKLPSTNISARIARFDAIYDVVIFSTEAFAHLFLLTGLTIARMTISFAFVFVAVEIFFAFFAALINKSIFTALDHPLTFSTLARDHTSFKIAGRALSRMTC